MRSTLISRIKRNAACHFTRHFIICCAMLFTRTAYAQSNQVMIGAEVILEVTSGSGTNYFVGYERASSKTVYISPYGRIGSVVNQDLLHTGTLISYEPGISVVFQSEFVRAKPGIGFQSVSKKANGQWNSLRVLYANLSAELYHADLPISLEGYFALDFLYPEYLKLGIQAAYQF
jgi:hypothetical protein